MIIIKITFLYFIEIAHTDDSPSTGNISVRSYDDLVQGSTRNLFFLSMHRAWTVLNSFIWWVTVND